jgi:hypothetical protein
VHLDSTSTAKPQTASDVVSHGSRFFSVRSYELKDWWPLVAHLIKRWVDEDGIWSVTGVREEIEAARAQLWCMHHGEIIGIWVTRIDVSDCKKFGLVWGCAGNFEAHKADAVDFFGIIEDWFRAQGCEFVEICGRDWSRILSGYRKRGVILRKRL